MAEPIRLPEEPWSIDDLTEDPEIPDVTELMELIEELSGGGAPKDEQPMPA